MSDVLPAVKRELKRRTKPRRSNANAPFAILDGAPWVTSEEAKAAALFLQFLLSKPQQSELIHVGFRPSDRDVPLNPPIDERHGADPEANIKMVEMPETEVINAIVELWECIRQGDCPR